MALDLTAHVDFETFSEADLVKTGAHIYAAHPSTELLNMGYAIGDVEPTLWAPGMPLPDDLIEHILMGGEIAAWNAQFERLIFRHVAVRYGFPVPALEQYDCVMVRALAMSLPGSLDFAAKAIQLPIHKDDIGARIMFAALEAEGVVEGDAVHALHS